MLTEIEGFFLANNNPVIPTFSRCVQVVCGSSMQGSTWSSNPLIVVHLCQANRWPCDEDAKGTGARSGVAG